MKYGFPDGAVFDLRRRAETLANRCGLECASSGTWWYVEVYLDGEVLVSKVGDDAQRRRISETVRYRHPNLSSGLQIQRLQFSSRAAARRLEPFDGLSMLERSNNGGGGGDDGGNDDDNSSSSRRNHRTEVMQRPRQREGLRSCLIFPSRNSMNE